jgi:Flp pilus assembly CpaF family ATPase
MADADEKTDPEIVIPPGALASRAAAAPVAPTIKLPSLGPLDPFLQDPEVTEIMVNDLRNVIIEKSGQMLQAGFRLSGLDELNRLARTILDFTGRILSPDQPYVDTYLPDGSRVNLIGPPLAPHGVCITIRKFPARRLTLEQLAASGTLDARMVQFLAACVAGKLNVLISGGTGSGKTTLLNSLIQLVPRTERLIAIEDTPELVLPHINSVKLQTKAQMPASAAIPARELVANALRMRPDRIIVGECRRAEAFDMLQAMNTGHDGSMTTIHANSARDALARVETLCLLAGVDLPLVAIRKQMASAIDLVIQVRRFRDGRRRVVGISELTGMEGETITLQELFAFEAPASAKGAAKGANPSEDEFATSGHGAFKCTGYVPTFLAKLRDNGVDLPKRFFDG